MTTQTRTDFHEAPRTNSPSSASYLIVRNDAMSVAALILGALALAFSISAITWAYVAERDNKIMLEDVRYIRSYLNARGIEIPGSHEEGEEK